MKNKSIHIKEEIERILAMPFLSTPLDKFKISEVRQGMEWQREQVLSLIDRIEKAVREDTYEDILYRLSFMDAEDTIEDVIKDIEHRKLENNPNKESEK